MTLARRKFIEANKNRIDIILKYKKKNYFSASELCCLPCFSDMSLRKVIGFLQRGHDRGVFIRKKSDYKRGHSVWMYRLNI